MRNRYKDLSLQQIRAFRDLCRAGSYAAVAREVRLSTSAIWEQIRGLERHLDLTLVESHQGRVRPTADGARLLQLAEPHFSGLEVLKEVLHQLRGEPPAQLTFVSGMRMLTEEIPPAVARFNSRYPGVRVHLTYAPDREINSIVSEGQADLGLIIERPEVSRLPHGVFHEFGYTLDFLLVAPVGHPLLKKRSLKPADLVKYPLVIGADGTATRSLINSAFYRNGLQDHMRVSVETNSSAITFACVREGSGIGITAASPETLIKTGLGVRSLKTWFGAARFVFVWKHGAQLLPVHRELAELVRQSAHSSARN